jgi:hypothetical protein
MASRYPIGVRSRGRLFAKGHQWARGIVSFARALSSKCCELPRASLPGPGQTSVPSKLQSLPQRSHSFNCGAAHAQRTCAAESRVRAEIHQQPTAFAATQKNWSRSHQTSTWPQVARGWTAATSFGSSWSGRHAPIKVDATPGRLRTHASATAAGVAPSSSAAVQWIATPFGENSPPQTLYQDLGSNHFQNRAIRGKTISSV